MRRLHLTLRLLLLPGALAAQTNRGALLERIDSLVTAEMKQRQLAGVSVGVEQRGDLVLAKGYGYADLEHQVPATAETVYRLGSLTKQFTATGIMQLMEQGKLGLQDSITRFLPGYPTQGHKVTMYHLLTHTSGIKSYTSLGPKFWDSNSRLDLTNDQMLALFQNEPFDFAPGEKYAYNNSGFFLLGVIIEKVSGLPYPKYLEEKILRPLGLTATLYCDERPIIPHRAQGYEVVQGVLKNDGPISMNTPGAAGAMCSTVLDLLAWQRAFNQARLIQPGSRDLMRTEGKLNNGEGTKYGFGIGIGALEEHRAFSHGGGINGFSTSLANYPDDSLTVVVLTNNGNSPAGRIQQNIARLALGIPLPVVKDVATESSFRAQWVGVYDLGQRKLTVREANGALLAETPGLPPLRLQYQGDNEFRSAQQPDAVFTFRVAEGVPQVQMRMEGATLQGKRTP